MSNIVELRAMRNGLVKRANAITEASFRIFEVKAMFTQEMFRVYQDNWQNDQEEIRDVPLRVEEAISTEMVVINQDFLLGLIDRRFVASNIVHEMMAIVKSAMTKHLRIEQTTVPEITGWTDEEIRMVCQRYRNQINTLTHHLRDIHTHWKYLMEHKSRLPQFIKSAVTGMFGGPDHSLGFEYSEMNFRCRGQDDPKVLTAFWLAPFIGTEKARVIETQLAIIGDESAPRPGEPPTLDYFSSHTSNQIDVFWKTVDDD